MGEMDVYDLLALSWWKILNGERTPTIAEWEDMAKLAAHFRDGLAASPIDVERWVDDWMIENLDGGTVLTKHDARLMAKEFSQQFPTRPPPQAGIAKLRELREKLKYALTQPIDNWRVEGKAIYHKLDERPLIRDGAADSDSLSLIVASLNFSVRQLMLNKFREEFDAVLDSLTEGERITTPGSGATKSENEER